MSSHIRIRYVVFLLLLTTASRIAVAQKRPDSSIQKIDTSISKIKAAVDSFKLPSETDSEHVDTVKKILQQGYEDSSLNQSDTVIPILVKKIQSVSQLIAAANRISEKGLDTVAISKELTSTEYLLNIVESNFIRKNAFQNLRALKSTKGVLIQSEFQLEAWQNTLFEYTEEIADLKVKLTEARADPIFKKIPKDSLLRDIYFGQIAGQLVNWKKAEASLNVNMLRLGVLENRVASDLLKTKDFLEKTDEKLKKYIANLWVPEEPSLFNAKRSDYDASFFSAFASSITSVTRLILYFAQLKIRFLVVTVILILAFFGWLMRTFYRLKRDAYFSHDLVNTSRFVTKRSLLSVTALALIFMALFFFSMPPSWNSLVWTLIAIVFFMISRVDEKSKTLFRPEVLIVFLVFNTLSVFIKNSLGERWLEFVFDLVTIGYSIFVFRQIISKRIVLDNLSMQVLGVFAVFSAGALICNSYGSFMLAKILNTGAVYAVLAAIVLFMSLEIIVHIILLHGQAFKGNRFLSYFDVHNREQLIRKFLRVVMIAAWVLIMIQQLNLFDYGYNWIFEFFSSERKLASHSFTFGSIFIFIAVIWLSAFIAKMLSVFLGDGVSSSGAKKSWWGSKLILIRLGILSFGILIAFLAADIPLDKITIIIGALGIGIGFGLQNIVNNLVSGVILAFERPMQVGDAIEVGSRYGIIKEIGIRASKITTMEGSEVIVPNGDMLSQHIVNWTLTSNYRRVEIFIGVSYNTDLDFAEKILNEIIAAQKGIEHKPSPLILVHDFAESAVNFRLLFWCHIDIWINIKSEILMKVHKLFAANNIEIPFPQRDLNIKGVDNLLNRENKEERDEEPLDY
jgi:small-conductance mechanosensitive channel